MCRSGRPCTTLLLTSAESYFVGGSGGLEAKIILDDDRSRSRLWAPQSGLKEGFHTPQLPLVLFVAEGGAQTRESC